MAGKRRLLYAIRCRLLFGRGGVVGGRSVLGGRSTSALDDDAGSWRRRRQQQRTQRSKALVKAAAAGGTTPPKDHQLSLHRHFSPYAGRLLASGLALVLGRRPVAAFALSVT